MAQKQSGNGSVTKYGIGAVLAEGILFVDLYIDLCSGKLTWQEFLSAIVICIIITIPVFVIMRNYFRRKR